MNDKLKPGVEKTGMERNEAMSTSQAEGDRTVFRQGKTTGTENVVAKNADSATRVKPLADNKQYKVQSAPNHKSMPRQAVSKAPDATRLKQPGQQAVNPANTRIPDKTRRPAQAEQMAVNASNRARYDRNQRRVLKDRFTLEKVIGVGGMGIVYRAIDKLKVEARDREPYVAIKVLSEEFKTHPESFIALQRESRKTQRIAHPNVVKVYDFDRDGDTVFMTMEYMEGMPLDQLIKQYSATGLPREEAWTILHGLCSALIYAHAENIVHSDFKPGNIFVTDAGIPKIFDFGIARAVANVDRLTGKAKDRTVFDAGSLGALTPAYASLEMLIGQKPDVRDDIYALGCIAYEMLTGVHPFNRLPADEACKSKLKPKRIASIKKRQWRAIENALMFKRENRTPTVEEFYAQIQTKPKSISIVLPTILVLSAIGAASYFILSNQQKSDNSNVVQVDKIKFKIQYDLYKQKIQKLLKDATFTESWQDSMWDQVSGLMALLKDKPDSWLTSTRRNIYQLYLNHFTKALNDKDFDLAKTLLKYAYRYTDDPAYLDSEKIKLAQLIRSHEAQLKAMAEKRRHDNEISRKQSQKAKRDDYLFGLALKNVNQQLECQTNLNMREFSIAINKLRSVDVFRYNKLKNGIVTTLAQCISHVGKTQPERAMEDKKYALRIFAGNSLIKAISIIPRDACNKSIAGLGARGERAVCRDKMRGGGMGPAMVVIPGNGRIRTFAIGKYEVSVKEIDDFCHQTRSCDPLRQHDKLLPAVNIGINTVKSYLRWLSRVTKQKYRLPTRKEWVYAAKANGKYQDPNRNCALNSRGIEKGGSLVRANTGAQNGWGLVNFLGNASEWVYDKSHNLDAVGGSYRDSMDKCTISSMVHESGAPDPSTGFRVVREVTR